MNYSVALEENLKLYDRHRVASGLLFWFPTSILFFLERVELGTALRLGSVYFLAVVLLEVPSGWMSDRHSRVLTLRLGAGAMIGAYATFLLSGSSLMLLALAQVLVAVGFAMLSGTDVSFHYDTLEALGRSSEFESREAAAGRNAFLATAVAAVIGGALGLIDLRLPFLASLAAAVYQMTLALKIVEPAMAGHERRVDPNDVGQIGSCMRYLARPGLAWIFIFLTLQQPLEGLAIDLIQPWLAELVGSSLSEAGSAPLVSGLLLAVISFIGAFAAAKSQWLRRRFGVRGSLALLSAVEVLILVALASVTTLWLIPLLALRSTQAAAGPVIVASASAPHLAKRHRATFLSLGSLAGRLAYGLVLWGLGTIDDFAVVLDVSVVIGVASLAVLGISNVILGKDDLQSAVPAANPE